MPVLKSYVCQQCKRRFYIKLPSASYVAQGTVNPTCPHCCEHAPDAPADHKDDAGKRRWDLLPWRALGLVADVLTVGAAKHGDDGWRTLPNARRRYYAATLRHLTAWWEGEALDHDDGLPHMAHAIADALLLLALDLRAPAEPAPEPTPREPRT
jgi:DNA-directed RNA polymerase subunit RPC12/RpoP